MSSEIVDVVEIAYAEIIQIGINFGIPFDHVPSGNAEVVYLQQTIIWVTFVLGLTFKGLGKLIGSMIGGVR